MSLSGTDYLSLSFSLSPSLLIPWTSPKALHSWSPAVPYGLTILRRWKSEVPDLVVACSTVPVRLFPLLYAVPAAYGQPRYLGSNGVAPHMPWKESSRQAEPLAFCVDFDESDASLVKCRSGHARIKG